MGSTTEATAEPNRPSPLGANPAAAVHEGPKDDPRRQQAAMQPVRAGLVNRNWLDGVEAQRRRRASLEPGKREPPARIAADVKPEIIFRCRLGSCRQRDPRAEIARGPDQGTLPGHTRAGWPPDQTSAGAQ